MEMDGAIGEGIVSPEYFEDLPDLRQADTVAFELEEILLLPAGGPGRGGSLHRYRPFRDEKAGVVAALPALSWRDTSTRPSGRDLRDAGCG